MAKSPELPPQPDREPVTDVLRDWRQERDEIREEYLSGDEERRIAAEQRMTEFGERYRELWTEANDEMVEVMFGIESIYGSYDLAKLESEIQGSREYLLEAPNYQKPEIIDSICSREADAAINREMLRRKENPRLFKVLTAKEKETIAADVYQRVAAELKKS